MRYRVWWLVILATAVHGQNWEISPIRSEPGNWVPVAIATDSLCLPQLAFGISGDGVIGYATTKGDTWEFTYLDSGGAISSIEICLDSEEQPHLSYVVSRYPEPNELRYASKDGDTWCIEAVARNATLYSLALARDGTPHMVFVDSARVKYAYRAGDTWNILTVPAYQADTLRRRGGASLALDTSDQPGVAVTWTKHGPDDSLWLSFFEYDGQDWHRFDVDSAQGWAPWDFWPVRVRCDPATDLFHVVYRAYRYAVGKGEDWQIEGTWGKTAGNVFCDFVLHQGRPHVVCASTWDPLTYQWRWAGGWETETVRNGDVQENMSIAVDRTGIPHVVFQSFDNGTLYYARRLFVGAEEPAATAQPETRVLVYPNPAARAFTLEFPVLSRTTATITLSDALGRTVWSQEENIAAGCYRRSISLPASVKSGVYFCIMDIGARRISRKVVLTD